MPVVVGVRFKDSGKTYYFDPLDVELNQGDYVIVDTARGLELAKVAYQRREVPDSEIIGELKPVVRRAEPTDLERQRLLHGRHEEVLARCAEKIREHSLPMSLVKAEYSFDGSRLTFYFTAEKRVDFRMLVRDLARTFKSRIELRQIGPRDEAKLLGGIGPCGRVLCCASFLPDYARVSIKMAKDQDLPLNPAKISGVCGRLLCCLSYEHEQYIEMRAELPRRGTWVQTPDGPGEVLSQHVLKQQLIVQLSSGMIETYDLSAIEVASAQVAATARARNAEGITPPAQRQPRPERDRGERRKLRDEIDQYDLLDDLSQLEDERGGPDPLTLGKSAPSSAPKAAPKASAGSADPPREQRRPPRQPRPAQRAQQPEDRQAAQPPPRRPPSPAPAAPEKPQPSPGEGPSGPRRRRRRGGRGGKGEG
ncbi:stage 0 sporulation family protein [Chloroflexales bacterium ZM16-3]|nr:stage 0 sporulation family protein [Chloroflexales bacterium ZM16-3]